MRHSNSKQARQGCWTRLIVDHYASLTTFFRRRLARSNDAEDLVQEAYLRLIRSDSGNGRSIQNPEAYLFTVAANLVREHAVLNKRAALQVDVEQVAPEWLAVDDAAPATLDDMRRQREIDEALATLSPGQRTAMLLHYREGLTYAEAAVRMGTSANMVKKHIARALVTCRLHLVRPSGS